ncbi:MAG: Gfo/Idh/MocA family oxidoreductase [Clostridia bacterium]|nr:Gfo/Idh/MocA family oxidoreductase [Clostridia bacterium]
MQKIGIGVIGWGFMGKTHTHALREIPLFYQDAPFRPVLKAVCAAHYENAEIARRDAGFETACKDWQELLRVPGIDVVSVCTPNSLHEEIVVAALKAGKHVYVDKPIATDSEAASRIRDAVKESGRLLMVANNNRFLPATMRARELIDEGRLGTILSFRCDYLHSGSIDPNRPAGWKQLAEGGVLLDLGAHALDLINWLAGKPQRVLCAGRVLYPVRPARGGAQVEITAEDQALCLLQLKNGALGSCEVSKIATGTEDELRFEICGDRGALRFNLMQPNYLEFYDNTLPDRPLGGEKGFVHIAAVARYPAPGGRFLPVKNPIGWDRGHMHAYFTFLDCVARQKAPAPDADEALYLAREIDALKESIRSGRWIDLPDVTG